MPVRTLPTARPDLSEAFLPAQEKSASTKSSRAKYSRPTIAIKAPPDKLQVVSNQASQKFAENVHQRNVLDFHGWEKGENAHDQAGNAPTGTEERVCFEERQPIRGWPECPKHKKTCKDLTVNVSEGLSVG